MTGSPTTNDSTPLAYRWNAANPLPIRRISKPTNAILRTSPAAPGYYASGPSEQPFDFCARMNELLADILVKCPPLHTLDLGQILVCVTQARDAQLHGLQAQVTPLRFRRGQLIRKRQGSVYQVQRYFFEEREYLYLLKFCLPRFLDQDFDEKLITVFHELYHISPACDGDLRRHEGRYELHSHSQREYDRHMVHLARSYLDQKPDPQLHGFLRLNFDQLEHRHGSVVGIVVPRPQIVKTSEACLRAVQESTGQAE